jgi:hypothetical protein
LKTSIKRRKLQTSNYKRNPCISKFYSPQLALCHSGFYDCPRGKALGQSNALEPQSQFRAVKHYFTGSAYIVMTFLFLLYMPVFAALAGGKVALYRPLQAPLYNYNFFA